ncbi:BQ5605_C002g01244 [Microbotryum silenes-dioicae]|uniref:DNA polymerase n=1 Tax=Microbotryum silenes-dioicae TaxID=796604 RepID=A0A2X0NVV3_9BASI|nr:BQ5605_C002g01244 [Microbotryum silenes-dioicae]
MAAAHHATATAPTTPSPSTIIRFKLSDIDTVMSSDKTIYTNDQSPFVVDPHPGGPVPPMSTVPVIRIFGATDRGKRVMAHIHGAFPYVYIKYLGASLEPDAVNAYIKRLARALNLAMDYMTRDPQRGNRSNPNAKAGRHQSRPGQRGGAQSEPATPAVAFIVPCKGIPFYGYHVGHEAFLKIYITRPTFKIRLSETLRSGVIMKTKFDVFEDHAPFLLQFMLDCDLHGCGWVEVDECRFRKLPQHEWSPSDDLDPPSIDGPYHTRVYNSTSVPLSLIYPRYADDSPAPVSTCPIEIDVPIYGIHNRHKIKSREIQQDFIEFFQREELNGSEGGEQDKLVLSLRELWTDERRRREVVGEVGPGEVKDSTPRQWDKRGPTDPIWADEPRLRAKVDVLLQEDIKAYRAQPGFAQREPEWKTFVDEQQVAEKVQRGFMERLKTTFAQVDAVFLTRLEQDRRSNYEYGALIASRYDFANKNKSRTRSPSRPPSEDFDEKVFRAGSTQAQIERIVDEDEVAEMIYDQAVDEYSERAEVFNTQYFGDLKRRARQKDGSGDEAIEEEREKEDGEDNENGEAGVDVNDLFDGGTESDLMGPESSPQAPPPAQTSRADVNNGYLDSDVGSPADSVTSDFHDDGNRAQRQTYKVPIALDSMTPESLDETSAFEQTFKPMPTPARTPSVPFSTRSTSRSPTKQNLFRSPTKAVKVRRATSGASSASNSALGSDMDDEDDEHEPFLTFREHDTSMSDDDLLIPPVQQASGDDPSDMDGDLEEHASEILEEYVPTPTQVEAVQPSMVPVAMRSFIEVDEEVPISSHGSRGTIRSRGSSGRSASVSSLDAPPTTKRMTLRFDVSESESQSSFLASASNPPYTSELSIELEPISSATHSSGSRSAIHSPSLLLPLQNSNTSSTSSGRVIHTDHPVSARSWIYREPAPSAQQVLETLEMNNQPRVDYTNPYYSNPADVPRVANEYGGRRFVLRDQSMRNTPAFNHLDRRVRDAETTTRGTDDYPRMSKRSGDKGREQHALWEYVKRPPTRAEVKVRAKKEDLIQEAKSNVKPRTRGIEGPTQHQDGFKFTPVNGAPAQREKQHMAVLAMELHVNTREGLLPNPLLDPIQAIFYCLQSENDDVELNGRLPDTHVGCIAMWDAADSDLRKTVGPTDYGLEVVDDELSMIATFLDLIVNDWDPEALAGYEVHHSSWGYLLERAKEVHDWNLVPELGRMEKQSTGRHGNAQSDRWGFTQSSALKFTGRHVLPIWRILSSDNRMQHAAFEHVVFQILKQRCVSDRSAGLTPPAHTLSISTCTTRTPHFSHKTLTKWYTSGNPRYIAKVLEYWRNRVEMDIEMLEAAEIIEQNCESARVFGVDFRSVRTRGSQFKVEAVMFKLAKPESFVLLSPNRVQVGHQNAAECGPLIMEPQSAFYKGPLVVLDFQSLYPSVMIAYNYCYSCQLESQALNVFDAASFHRTCLGRIERFKSANKFGTTTIDPPPGLLELMKEHITISPNGMMFVKREVRRSLLAKMLSELLDTRVMVKSSMKRMQDDRALTKLLNARQLALKFLANVTYGYTSATFSGRMPCVEIADAIVQTGRETLEKAIVTVKSRVDWGAEVVYGDTDSLFIYLPGKSKDDAFRIGHEMADTITSMNPRPIKLKFEKVYLPCVLLAKKRYVGFKYEYPAQLEPDFDAKGIETVRRDGIAATQKMQEACIKILFRSQDLSVIKAYLQRQWEKLLLGDVSPQDFVYAKAVKLGNYALLEISEGRVPPPGAMVAQRAIKRDPRAEPEYGERVPYILFQSVPGEKQIDHAASPEEFLSDPRLRLDAKHYIERAIIPPLARIFNLIGVDITQWFKQMPRSLTVVHARSTQPGARKALLEEFLKSDRCRACGASGGVEEVERLCPTCLTKPGEVVYQVHTRMRTIHSKRMALRKICASCSSAVTTEEIECDSTDCPVLWDRMATEKEAIQIDEVFRLLT